MSSASDADRPQVPILDGDIPEPGTLVIGSVLAGLSGLSLRKRMRRAGRSTCSQRRPNYSAWRKAV